MIFSVKSRYKKRILQNAIQIVRLQEDNMVTQLICRWQQNEQLMGVLKEKEGAHLTYGGTKGVW